MANSIDYTKNWSFFELDWKPGEVMGFENSNTGSSNPFILAIPRNITRGLNHSGLRLSFQHSSPDTKRLGKMEELTLHPRGQMLALGFAGMNNPRFGMIEGGYPRHQNSSPFVVENAYSGKEAVRHALNEKLGFSYYAHLMDTNKLIVKRGRVEGLLEKLGLESILPNKLRLKGYKPEGVYGE